MTQNWRKRVTVFFEERCDAEREHYTGNLHWVIKETATFITPNFEVCYLLVYIFSARSWF